MSIVCGLKWQYYSCDWIYWIYCTVWDMYMQVLYLGRAPRTKETLPDFREKCRVTRHLRVFRGLTGSQRTRGIWGVTHGVVGPRTAGCAPDTTRSARGWELGRDITIVSWLRGGDLLSRYSAAKAAIWRPTPCDTAQERCNTCGNARHGTRA